MGGLAVGQVLLGPVSDRFGRKAVLLFSLFLYLSATVGCLCSESIWIFTFFRFLEGIGAAGGIVLSRSVATDLYHGRQLAKIIAFISAINGLAPIAAPLSGGLVAQIVGWRGIFLILLSLGICLTLGSLFFRESLPPDRRSGAGWKNVLKGFATFSEKKVSFPPPLPMHAQYPPFFAISQQLRSSFNRNIT